MYEKPADFFCRVPYKLTIAGMKFPDAGFEPTTF
jgi:hypothetical protein